MLLGDRAVEPRNVCGLLTCTSLIWLFSLFIDLQASLIINHWSISSSLYLLGLFILSTKRVLNCLCQCCIKFIELLHYLHLACRKLLHKLLLLTQIRRKRVSLTLLFSSRHRNLVLLSLLLVLYYLLLIFLCNSLISYDLFFFKDLLRKACFNFNDCISIYHSSPRLAIIYEKLLFSYQQSFPFLNVSHYPTQKVGVHKLLQKFF